MRRRWVAMIADAAVDVAKQGVEIIEGRLMPDRVHMLASIPPKMSASSFIGSVAFFFTEMHFG